MDVLKLKERVELALELGEGHYREFKSAQQGKEELKTARPIDDVIDDVVITLIAFANADGGELFVGVEDNAVVTGLPNEWTKGNIEKLMNVPKEKVSTETPLSIRSIRLVEFSGQTILYFSVSKGSGYFHQSTKGESYTK
jgi:ATP-dependent DNA helicase RecG